MLHRDQMCLSVHWNNLTEGLKFMYVIIFLIDELINGWMDRLMDGLTDKWID